MARPRSKAKQPPPPVRRGNPRPFMSQGPVRACISVDRDGPADGKPSERAERRPLVPENPRKKRSKIATSRLAGRILGTTPPNPHSSRSEQGERHPAGPIRGYRPLSRRVESTTRRASDRDGGGGWVQPEVWPSWPDRLNPREATVHRRAIVRLRHRAVWL